MNVLCLFETQPLTLKGVKNEMLLLWRRNEEEGKTTYTINKKGYHLLIDEVPAWICEQCGEPYFEGNVVDAIQKLVGAVDVRVENV